jgi:sec-independent protein translocase protein TatA
LTRRNCGSLSAIRERPPPSSLSLHPIFRPFTHTHTHTTQDVVRRGLFGLGVPELAVIAGVAALIFGAFFAFHGRVRPITPPAKPRSHAPTPTPTHTKKNTTHDTGPSKLPSLGKELGKTAKSFQTAAKEFEKELKSAAAEEEGGEKKE